MGMANVKYLMYECTLAEVLKLKEGIEMMTAFEMASHKDMDYEMSKRK